MNFSFLLKLFKNRSTRFIFVFITGIIIWFTLYHFIYKLDVFFSSEKQLIDIQKSISILIGKQSNFLLSILGYVTSIEIHSDMVVTLIENKNFNHGVWIGEPCNGLKLFGVFAIFILAFPGEIKHKIWYIPLGISLLHIINVIRIAILTILSAYNPYLLNFNHNITFQLIIYSFIFLLWYIWTKKLSAIKSKNE
mgnify:FL=1